MEATSVDLPNTKPDYDASRLLDQESAASTLHFQSLLTTRKSPAKHLTYWHRQHTSKTKLPILFIHGIGIGLYTYVKFLSDINLGGTPDDQVGITAIEIMPVS